MNIVILFILNILTIFLSYASFQNTLSVQKYQMKAGSIRNIQETSSLRQTPIVAQGETPLFAKDFQFGDTPINPISVQSLVASPISPSFELILEEVFNDYYYNHPCLKHLILDGSKEKKIIFTVFLNFLKVESNFFKFDTDNFEENFRRLYGIDANKEFTQDQQLEFEKYIKHEEAKEKIRERWRIEKNIDIFINEENKKIKAA